MTRSLHIQPPPSVGAPKPAGHNASGFLPILLLDRLASSLRRRVLGISMEAVRCARRGFSVNDQSVRKRLEDVGRTFVLGYRRALEDPRPTQLALALESVQLEDRGFAFEGAAMALALLDNLTPWRRDRLASMISGPGDPHAYMMHVGAGWALARLRRTVLYAVERGDPILRWLIVDGYGFHEGYFRTKRTIVRRVTPTGMKGYASRAFDQGLGRCLWFAVGASPRRISATIAAFPGARHGDLWSGVGLACAYAGGVAEETIHVLADAAAPHCVDLAVGVAFAAKARQRARNPATHTDLACEIVWGRSSAAVAIVTDESLDALRARFGASGGGSADCPAFEVWRSGIRAAFTGRKVIS